MADDRNPLFRKDMYALGRSDQAKGKINPRLYGNRKYMQGLQDERTRQIDAELRKMPKPKPGSWGKSGFGNASDSGTSKELRPACLDLGVFLLALPLGLLLGLWMVMPS